MGFDQYKEGNWMRAKKFFEKAISFLQNDKPTLNLLEFMSSYNNKVPSEWN